MQTLIIILGATLTLIFTFALFRLLTHKGQAKRERSFDIMSCTLFLIIALVTLGAGFQWKTLMEPYRFQQLWEQP